MNEPLDKLKSFWRDLVHSMDEEDIARLCDDFTDYMCDYVEELYPDDEDFD